MNLTTPLAHLPLSIPRIFVIPDKFDDLIYILTDFTYPTYFDKRLLCAVNIKYSILSNRLLNLPAKKKIH